MSKKLVGASCVFLLNTILSPLHAVTYKINKETDLVGEIQSTRVLPGEYIEDVARKYSVGVFELIEANPRITPKTLRVGSFVTIPSRFILPSGSREGLVINLAEMRIYFFHRDGKHVSTYPVGIGRKDWETPLGVGTITQKTPNPSWVPPKSIRAWYEERGMYLPKVVPPGPKNPLGAYALRLSIPGYLIHGTNQPSGIGLRSSSGCIRMYPEDIAHLFSVVSVGTKVRIVNKPYKIGKHAGQVYIEAHRPLSGELYSTLTPEKMLQEAFSESNVDLHQVDLEEAVKFSNHAYGYPEKIHVKQQRPK